MKRGLRIGGSLILLALLAWRVDLTHVVATLTDVRWGWWLGGVACYLVAQLVSAVRWRRLSQPLGFDRPTTTYLSYVFVGNFFNLLLPTSVGGDVARAWYLGRGSGHGARAALSVLADRLNGLYVLVVLACVAALFVTLPVWATAFIALSAVGGVVSLLLLWLASGGRPSPESSTGWRRKWGELVASLAFYRRSPALLGTVTLLSFAVQLLNVLLVWCLAGAVGAAVPLTFCCVLMPIVTLLTLAPVSVNGMGVREAATLLLLTPLGVAEGVAITLSLLWFGVFVTAGLVGGACFLADRLPRCEGSGNAERLGSHSDQGRVGQSAVAA